MSGDECAQDAGAEQAFERELLASAAGDRVSDERVQAAWSRFAVALGATATLAGTATRGTAASGVTAGARGAVRWVSLGALGGGVVTAAVMTAFGGRGTPATGGVGAPTPSSVAATTPGPAPSTQRPVRVEPSDVDQAAPSEPSAAAPAPKRSHSAPVRESATPRPAVRPDTSSSLAAEIALLDEARRAQSAGQLDRALSVLARYQREHPQGALRREGDLLRLETLSRRGDQEEAARLARGFLAAFPDDPHATRVRAFVR